MKYSVEIKNRAIQLYRRGKSTSRISWELDVPRPSIQSWINIYLANGIIGLREAQRRPIKGEDKITIVKEVLENNLSCNAVALKHGLSSSAVVRWTAIVRAKGYAALQDMKYYSGITTRMKKAKKRVDPTINVGELVRENQLLKAENEYLKKLQTLVEKRIARKNGSKSKPSKD